MAEEMALVDRSNDSEGILVGNYLLERLAQLNVTVRLMRSMNAFQPSCSTCSVYQETSILDS